MLKSLISKWGLAYVEVEEASYDKILKLFQDGIEYTPTTIVEHLYLGVFHHYVKRNYDQSLIYYKYAADNGNIAASNNLGNLYLDHLKDKNMAIYYFQRALDLSENDTQRSIISRGLAVLYDKNQDYDKAVSYYKKTLDVNCSGEVCFELADMYHSTEKYDDAILYYEKAITYGYSFAIPILVNLYVEQNKNFERMKRLCQQAVTLRHSESILDLVESLHKIGRHEDAFLLCHEYQSIVGESVLHKLLNALTYPISPTNKIAIYNILETIKLPTNMQTNGHVFIIMQDVIWSRQELMCKLIYHLKKNSQNNNVK